MKPDSHISLFFSRTPPDSRPLLRLCPGSGMAQPPAALPASLAIASQAGLSHWPSNVGSLGGSVQDPLFALPVLPGQPHGLN